MFRLFFVSCGVILIGLSTLLWIARQDEAQSGALAYFTNDPMGLSSVDLQSGQQTSITQSVQADFGFRFTPDGQHIVYFEPDFELTQILQVDVARDSAHVLDAFQRGVGEWTLSDNSQWLAYIAGNIGDTGTVFRQRVGTSVSEPIVTLDCTDSYNAFAWSVDFQYLALASNCVAEDDPSIQSVIYHLDVEAGTLTEIKATEHQHYILALSWSPDGEWLAFSQMIDGNADLYRMRADGSHVQRLTQTANFQETYPVWSPSGEWIGFLQEERGMGGRDIYRIRPDGTDLQRLTTDSNYKTSLVWHPAINLAWHPITIGLVGLVVLVLALIPTTDVAHSIRRLL